MKKTDLQDELDRTGIAQLHTMLLHISGNCFALKKLCATVLAGVETLLITITDHRLDPSLFVAGILITLAFWILDAQSYYYQEKLRDRMKQLANEMAARCEPPLAVVSGIGMPVSNRGSTAVTAKRILWSCLNPSMTFYMIVTVLIVITTVLYHCGRFHRVA
jgi:hypothetical protein